jgi:hypothetical protein
LKPIKKRKIDHVFCPEPSALPFSSCSLGVVKRVNPFLFIKNKWLFISSDGFFTLEKNALGQGSLSPAPPQEL